MKSAKLTKEEQSKKLADVIELTFGELALKVQLLEAKPRQEYLEELISHIEYKPNFSFHIRPCADGFHLLNIHMDDVINNRTGNRADLLFAGFIIPDFAKDEDVLTIIFRAIQELETHEARENFYFKGQRVYDPHIGMGRLIEMTKFETKYDYKLPIM